MPNKRDLLEGAITACNNLVSAMEVRLDAPSESIKALANPLVRELAAELSDVSAIVQEEFSHE